MAYKKRQLKGNIRFNPARPADRQVVESIMILSPHYYTNPQHMARMAIIKGLVDLAAEKQMEIPLSPKAQSAQAG